MTLSLKDLLSIDDLTIEDIQTIFSKAKQFSHFNQRPNKKIPSLRGKTVINFFSENSTRTRTSFEIAGKRLGADVINFSSSGSAFSKGETFLDTAKNLEAMQADAIVCRHASAGACHFLADNLDIPIINAGDGYHEHPTQALLDVFTILEKKNSIAGLKVAIVGDVSHSRVTRSMISILKKMDASINLVGPRTMMPCDVERFGVETFTDLKEGIHNADVVMLLRIQKERFKMVPFSSLHEYAALYGLNLSSEKFLKKDALVVHQGPINRGVELAPELADGDRSIILDQVLAGVAVRMAILHLICEGDEGELI